MQRTPPTISSLPPDWSDRKVVLHYGDKDNFDNVYAVPKGLFYAPMPGGTQPEWLVYVYDLDQKAERALRMSRVLNWRAVGASKTC